MEDWDLADKLLVSMREVVWAVLLIVIVGMVWL